ncbi:ABC-2 type transport system permease protein [Methylobacillus rhizosphaerae]|uniref:Transport permease protein n=1 Tax=Methylobacillus rhizosphaerae TaxID=551994 RepID=A0A238Y091_9PROT|nr:ABC transporter permease [Methylobacillus rhizosphaerae]SNR64372.1 ABC-2 type transport system permease protein [Methylobacillus rhizosphaerae]
MQDIHFSLRRIGAVALRHLYLMRSSWPRVLEMVYWPTVQMILWGFITLYLQGNSSLIAQASGLLLSGVLLWDVLFRGQLGIALVFMEEMWSRNLGHLFVSPLRPYEMVVSLLFMSLLRTLIGIGGATLIAIPLFQYSIYDMGLPLIAFFLNLIIMGWAIGLMVSGIVLRYGMGAESIAWVSVFAIQPLCAIYYPVATLPSWLQPVALALPASHVFEGMRELLLQHTFNVAHMQWAIGLNIVFLSAGIAVFLGYFRVARRRGLLLQVGE